MKIFAIVVTYKGGKWYDRCLGSLRDSGIPLTTIVVDNASGDGSVEYITEHFPEVVMMPQEKNLGFAKANNIGIRYAVDHGADYVFLLNQDAWIEKDTIGKLIMSFERNPDAGVVSPMHLNGAGTDLDWKSATNYSGDFVSDCFMGKLKEEYQLPYMNAAAWLISSKCLHTVGGFDTNLFVHYGEDGNYCQRLQFHGFSLIVNTKAKAFHDREHRKLMEKQYQTSVFNQSNDQRSSEYGNINYIVDIDKMISSCKKTLLKLKLRLRFKKAFALEKEIQYLVKVKKSRDINSGVGLTWL